MKYPHRIRLRGPWECQPLNGEAEARRVTMPCRLQDIGLADYRGKILFKRSFGYPGRIDDFERVWLTFAGIDGEAKVVLNEHSLGTLSGSGEFNVTSILAMRNRLEVTCAAEPDHAGLWGEVALEVRCRAFLKDVQARRDDLGNLQIAGRISGEPGDSLELYIRADGQHVHYAIVQAGQDFRVDLQNGDVRHVRVDLIQVSTIWDSVDLEI